MIDQQRLDETLRLHGLWLAGDSNGVRANLRNVDLRRANLRGANLNCADLNCADLSGANLREADLRGADLRVANLSRANLSRANLRDSLLDGADLTGADLTGAELRGANLTGADLRVAELPADYRIASLCFGGWVVTVTPAKTTIGCQTHPNEDWLRWSPDDVAEMHRGAKAWWSRHRDAVCAVIRDVMREENQ